LLRAGRPGERGSIPSRGGKIFSLTSGAHPAFCTMGTGGPFPETKAQLGGWRWLLTPIYSRGREWVGVISSLPQASSWREVGQL
jgi:hypothetical protein